jgi:hypothetical protein
MKTLRRVLTAAVAMSSFIVASAPGRALAYPNNEADCKAAGGIWKEHDTPDGGCDGFCYMHLGALLSGGGGPTGGLGDLLANLTQDTLRNEFGDRRLTANTLLAGDVSFVVANRSLVAAGASTCAAPGKGLGAGAGQVIGALYVSSASLVFLDDNGASTHLAGFYRVRVLEDGNGGASVTLLDSKDKEALHTKGIIHRDLAARALVPGGDPRAFLTYDALQLQYSWDGVGIEMTMPFGK